MSAGPQDRPPLSAPFAASTALALLYLFWGSAVPVGAMAVGALALGGADPVMPLFLPLLLLAVGPLLAVVFGFRGGRLWALRLMRVMTATAAVSAAFDAAVGLLQAFGPLGRTRHDALGGQFLLICTGVLAVLGGFLLRALLRTRWLDPRSSPEEWEPPYRIVYRRAR